MKTKMKMTRWFLAMVLAIFATVAMAQENNSPQQTVCMGEEPYRVEATYPGTVYNWSIAGGVSGTNWVLTGNGNDSITVNWMVPGTYTLSVYTFLNGCYGDTTSVLVTVQPPLTVAIAPSNPAPICEGMTITFTATVTNGGTNATYQWYEGTTPVAGATNSSYVYTGVAPGTSIYCEVTDPDACAANGTHTATSNVVDVTVNAQVALTVSITSDATEVCEGLAINFTATYEPVGATVTFQWYNGTTPIAGATSSTYQYIGPPGSATITCQVSSTDPCIIASPVTSNEITVVVKPKPVTSPIWHN